MYCLYLQLLVKYMHAKYTDLQIFKKFPRHEASLNGHVKRGHQRQGHESGASAGLEEALDHFFFEKNMDF